MNCKIEDTNDYTHNQVRLQSFTLQSKNKIILEIPALVDLLESLKLENTPSIESNLAIPP